MLHDTVYIYIKKKHRFRQKQNTLYSIKWFSDNNTIDDKDIGFDASTLYPRMLSWTMTPQIGL
jgi:hypothetical protein